MHRYTKLTCEILLILLKAFCASQNSLKVLPKLRKIGDNTELPIFLWVC